MDSIESDSPHKSVESETETKMKSDTVSAEKIDEGGPLKKLRECRGLSVGIICLSSFLCGCSLSILSPFYTKEAETHGLSVTASGLVFASVFFVQIIFTPIFGAFLQRIGTVNLFIGGLFVVGITNVVFGFLPMVQSGPGFLALSLIVRSFMAIGEAGMNTSVYPLARSQCRPGNEASMTGWVETMLGVGTTIGPFVGGVLFEYGGFCLPFVVAGSLILCSGLISLMVLTCKEVTDLEDDESDEDKNKEIVKDFRSAMKNPWILSCCLVTLLTGMSCQWYQPTLEPYLRDNFKMSSFQSSLFFIVDGGMYAIVTPLVGYILDRGLLPRPCLMVGSGCISLAFLVLASSSLKPSTVEVGLGIGLNGVGMSLTYLSSYQLLSCLATPGLATSLWISAENFGGVIGSLGGGAAFESVGWGLSCLIVVLAHLLALLFLSTSQVCRLGSFQRFGDQERKPLLRSGAKKIEIYGSNNNIVTV